MQQQVQGIWVALQRGGLCNNLKCLLSTMRLAERHNAKVVNSSPDLKLIFSDPPYLSPKSIPADAKTHKDWRLIVFDDDPIETGFSKTRESQGFADADAAGRNIDHEFHQIPHAMQQIYLDAISRLKVAPDLSKEIDRASAELLDDVDVAIHMRTWMTDNWDAAPNRHRHYFNFAYYESLVEEHGCVFVSADNDSYLQKLVDRFGDRVRYYQPDEQYHHSQVAFINLNLLSKTTRLIGSSLSTFTEMAWWLGDCKSEVTLVPRNKI